MQVILQTERDTRLRPAKAEISLLTAVPDRPAGTHELCPVVTLDDEAVLGLRDGLEAESATGALFTRSGGWAVLDVRFPGMAVVVALDLGDALVQRFLRDAPPAGLTLGLKARNAACVVRIPRTEAVAALLKRTKRALPASPEEQRALLTRLLGHLASRRHSLDTPGDHGLQEPIYVALLDEALPDILPSTTAS